MLNNEISNKKEIDSLLFPLARYISRMSTRCTPFGLLASCGYGQIGFETNIILEESINRKTRLDMYFLSTLYDVIIKIPEVKRTIKYYPNTSLYSIGKNYRYVEYLQRDGQSKYQIAEVKRCNYLKKLLRVAKDGANIKTLFTSLANDDISHENILEYINELIDSQVIVGELSQAITGKDYFTRIIELLDRVASDIEILISLKKIYNILERLDSKQDDNTKLYKHIVTLIKRNKIPYTEKFLFQVDLFRNTSSASLGNNVLNELKSAITFLNKITPSQENNFIRQFKQDFYKRYENQEVALMEALDPELGIGYTSKASEGNISPLIDSFYTPQELDQSNYNINSFQSLLLKKTAYLQ